MTMPRQKPIQIQPRELYIEPTSVCNLKCRMCYTNVINGPNSRVLEEHRILDLVRRFAEETDGPFSIYWCGTGEVFLHKRFPQMVNAIIERYGDGVTQTIQTNGTVDRLAELPHLAPLSFNVSIDGMREAHEWHRGRKTYDRTLRFCRNILDGGCRSLAIRMLLTRDNIYSLDEFHAELVQTLGPRFELRPMIPFPNRELRPMRQGSLALARTEIEDQRMLPREEVWAIMTERYAGRFTLDEDSPAVNNYLSLTPYGVFSCCNGIIKLGEPETDVAVLRERMAASESACRSCTLFPCN